MKAPIVCLLLTTACGLEPECTIDGWHIFGDQLLGVVESPPTCGEWRRSASVWTENKFLSLEQAHQMAHFQMSIHTRPEIWTVDYGEGEKRVIGTAIPGDRQAVIEVLFQRSVGLCRGPLFHELTHVMGANFYGDSDSKHENKEWWAEVNRLKHECAQLSAGSI